MGKDRKGGEAASVLPVPGSHPPALLLIKGGFASFCCTLGSKNGYGICKQALWPVPRFLRVSEQS